MHYAWIGLLILVVVIDIETSNVLMSWLGIGFLISFILGYVGVDMGVQIAVSTISSVPLLLLGNRISRKYIRKNIEPHQNNISKLVGMVITSDTDFKTESKQLIDGVYWRLSSASPIKEGESVKIVGMNGTRLLVEKIVEEKEQK